MTLLSSNSRLPSNSFFYISDQVYGTGKHSTYVGNTQTAGNCNVLAESQVGNFR